MGGSVKPEGLGDGLLYAKDHPQASLEAATQFESTADAEWSSLGLWATILGVVLSSLAWMILTWAMLTNPHFEATVRIQTDRDHRVVTTGPYAIVRHPGYVGAGLWVLGSPLIVGSVYGLIPAGITIVLPVLRTYLEDQTLQAELPDYAEYTKRVKCRLVPDIW